MAGSDAEQPSGPESQSENAGPTAYLDITTAEPEMLDSDCAASENGEVDASTVLREDDAMEMVGVSIGQAQTDMKSPQTPAVEKQKAIEDLGDEFPGEQEANVPEVLVQHAGEEGRSRVIPGQQRGAQLGHQSQSSALRRAQAPPSGLPRSDASRSFLRESLGTVRRRSSSGGSMTDSFKRLFPNIPNLQNLNLPKAANFPSLNLPKTPNLPSFNFSLSLRDEKPSSGASRHKRSSSLFPFYQSNFLERPSGSRSRGVNDTPVDSQEIRRPSLQQGQYDQPRTFDIDGAASSRVGSQSIERPRNLRRATSDNSLFLRKTQSRTSTLDDVQRWENIQEQVNSRFKAVKDSLQDTSIRLPKMPSVNLAAFRPDFQFGRAQSDMSRPNGSSETVEQKMIKEPRYVQVGNKNSSSGVPSDVKIAHPMLTRAMADLTGDVIVLGGYRGSILRSAKPPHRQLWVPVKVGLNLRKVDLEVGLNPEDEERMEETIIPSGTLSHIGPIDICRRLIKKLKKCSNAQNGDLRVWDYGYDWRLNPHLLSRRLISFLEGLPSNNPDTPPLKKGAFVIAHSLGGLITRHAINQRPDLFAGVVYAGVPQHCVNILGPMRNGDEVLLSSRVLTAQVNFTLRTSYALLPEDGRCFINKRTGERYDVDFFDAKTWDTYRLSPCVAPPLPPIAPDHRRSLIDTVSQSLPSLTIVSRVSSAALGKESSPEKKPPSPEQQSARNPVTAAADEAQTEFSHVAHEIAHPAEGSLEPSMSPHRGGIATACTIPKPAAMAYLKRTLAEVLQFKRELTFRESHQASNKYPPAAVLYGKSVPTVYGARVASRDAIKHSDAYDDLAFAAGDGVCLARAAQIPEGYRVVKGGLVKSERGHVGLLGDLEGVGACITAVIEGRKKGIGFGATES